MAEILIEDKSGRPRVISFDKFLEAVINNMGIIFGISFESIVALRLEYINRGGKLPITSESIREVFMSDEAEVSQSPSGSFASQNDLPCDQKGYETTIPKLIKFLIMERVSAFVPLNEGTILKKGDLAGVRDDFKNTFHHFACNHEAVFIGKEKTVRDVATEIIDYLGFQHGRFETWKYFAFEIFNDRYKNGPVIRIIYGLEKKDV